MERSLQQKQENRQENRQEKIEENIQEKKQETWWCIHFGQEPMEVSAAKKLQLFFKRVTPQVVFGRSKVFLKMNQSPWKNSLHLFQTKLSKIAKKINLHPEVWQWGVGNSLAESWVQARWRTLTPDLLPIEALSDYLNPLALERKSPHETRKLKTLRSLGVETLQDLIEMQEDDLIAQCGVWIADLTREHFSRPEIQRDQWLEKATAESLMPSSRSFQLEDWIPQEYLQAG